eukprot:gene19400-23226_t
MKGGYNNDKKKKQVMTPCASAAKMALKLSLVVIGFIIYNTLMFTSKQPVIDPLKLGHVDSYSSLSEDVLAVRLGKSIQFETVSYADLADIDYNEFNKFRVFLRETFPKSHQYLDVTVVANHSLLFFWKGSDQDLKPIMLAGHMDVVPVANLEDWVHPPFSGNVADGFIWGRGSMDDKMTVMALLESIEDLIDQGFRPNRSIYLGFGHDEEVGGYSGAQAIAAHLRARGVQLEYILDEGLPILLPPLYPGVMSPLATVGTTEKGALNIELSVEAFGGHSSMPPKQSLIGILANAVHRLEDNPMKTAFTEMGKMIDFVGREASMPYRIVYANMWLFRPIISYLLSFNPKMDAIQRTTTAITMFNSGHKPNVLPSTGTVVVNFRVSPSDTIEDVIKHVQETINDPRIRLTVLDRIEPAPVSSTEAPSFRLLQSTILQEFTMEAVVAPGIMIANTDTKWYWDLTFTPSAMTLADAGRFHGLNERISTSSYAHMVDFYYHLIRNGDKDLK